MDKSNTNTHKQVSDDLAKLFADDFSEASAARIGKAMEASHAYADDFISGAESMQDLSALAEDADIRRLLDEPLQKPRRVWGKLATAAVLLLAAAVTFQALWLPQPGVTEDVQRYTTRIGEQKAVKLDDGSTITLNTGTEVLVALNDDVRKVIMHRGEAFFDVAKDPNRPFRVELGPQSVSVLGTKFNIRRHPEQFVLSLVEGEVALHPSTEAVADNAASLEATEGGEISMAHPGQRRITAGWVVTYSMAEQNLLASQHDDLSSNHSWTTGFLEFHEQPLSAVVNELNRYSGKKILIGDSAIMDIQVYAGIRVDQLDQALRGLERTLPIKVISDFDSILIVGDSEQ
ncbi:FecR domain-containing protein [Porticoccus sp. W117]|uniref:FecR family protein n=1 Tax=Porticoccus sp. W117 TaxID=3054777 RepID=UPI0025957AA2|nr:FecR domain-containing protein [Porticoccus sp. W117]MDM3870839.1 FecR domain-containing protein [Porticoccus sp. W117]